MKVFLFFGSFNPIHEGHIKLAEHIISPIEDAFNREVWFVVSPCNPLKDKKDLLDENLRVEMLKLAIRKYKKFKICDIELSMPTPSYTIDTLNKLSELYPYNQFIPVIGTDNALIFDKWKDYKKILKNYLIDVYPRKGYDIQKAFKLYPKMRFYPRIPYYDISSTQIREDIEKYKEWLNKDVYKYIKENHLYEK